MAAFEQIFSSRCHKTDVPPQYSGDKLDVPRMKTPVSGLEDLSSPSFLRANAGLPANPTNREWWSQTGSNRRPPACKAGALPTELWPRCSIHADDFVLRPVDHRSRYQTRMVGPGRLELPTSRLSGVRSNHLSYGPPDATVRVARAEGDKPDRRNASAERKRNEDGGVPPSGPKAMMFLRRSDSDRRAGR